MKSSRNGRSLMEDDLPLAPALHQERAAQLSDGGIRSVLAGPIADQCPSFAAGDNLEILQREFSQRSHFDRSQDFGFGVGGPAAADLEEVVGYKVADVV